MTMPDPTPFPIDHVIERGGDADPALALREGTLSYADLRTRVGQLASWLREQGVEPGARIASWGAKGELTCLLSLAAPRAGLVHVPINPMLKRAQVAHILADSGALLLIGTPARLATLEDGDVPADCAMIGEVEVLDASRSFDATPASDAEPEEIAAILYTSGSTGKPKGVVLSHANMWLGAVSVAHYLGLASDDVTLAVLPLAFDYGQNQLLSTWYAGGCVAPLDYLMPRDVTKAVAKHGATTLAAVPPLWRQLVEAKWEAGAGDSLKRLTNSGGALTPDLIDAMRATWPQADIYPMYGLTEAFRSTFLDPSLVATHPTSMGKAVPFAEVLVVKEDGSPAAAGEEGELVHCGPFVAKGYWRDPERTTERYKPAPAHSE
jgi:acyl-CoA synthetase (AMP-forming)/AMP-acid ligase II